MPPIRLSGSHESATYSTSLRAPAWRGGLPIHRFHDVLLGGHPGADRTSSLTLKRFRLRARLGFSIPVCSPGQRAGETRCQSLSMTARAARASVASQAIRADARSALPRRTSAPFKAKIPRLGKTIAVGADQTLLEALEGAGVDMIFDCLRGTPPIVQAIGLGAALDYIERIGSSRIRAHEEALSMYAHERLSKINSLRIIGTAPGKGPILSFTMQGAHAHDIATLIDRAGVAVRAGTHCAMPLMHRFGVTSTCRASFALYNTLAEIDVLADALDRARTTRHNVY